MTPSVNAWKRHASAPSRTVGALAAGALVVAGLTVSTTPAAVAAAAPGAPGAMSHFDLARKDCLGTARNTTSKVWYTVADGVLSDVYYPTIDNTNVETLQYVVTDGSTFTDLQTRDMTYTVQSPRPVRDGLPGHEHRARAAGTRIVTDYVTDPQRASVVMHTHARKTHAARPAAQALRPLRRDGQRQRRRRHRTTAGADDAVIDTSTGSPGAGVDRHRTPTTNAANRDYAPARVRGPARRPAVPGRQQRVRRHRSDGLAQLDAEPRGSATTYDNAPGGNVVQTAQVDLRRGQRLHARARLRRAPRPTRCATAGRSAASDASTQTSLRYRAGWAAYDKKLKPPAHATGLSSRRSAATLREHLLPVRQRAQGQRGQDVPGRRRRVAWPARGGRRSAPATRRNTYFGSYREVFARDLYETFTGLVATGDIATAKDTVRFLFDRQQQPDGSMPAQQPGQRQARARHVRHPARRGGLPDPDGPHGRSDRQRVLLRAHQDGGGLPRRARPVVRVGAVGGAERLLTVDDRRRDRRPGRGRVRSPTRTATPSAHGSTGPRPTTTSATSRPGR